MSFICKCGKEFELTETRKKFQKIVYGLRKFECEEGDNSCLSITIKHRLHQTNMHRQKELSALRKNVKRYASRR